MLHAIYTRPSWRLHSGGILSFLSNSKRGLSADSRALAEFEDNIEVRLVCGSRVGEIAWKEICGRQALFEETFDSLKLLQDDRLLPSAAGKLHDVALLAQVRGYPLAMIALNLDGRALDRAPGPTEPLQVPRHGRERRSLRC